MTLPLIPVRLLPDVQERRLVPEARDELTRGEVRTLAEVRRALGVCAGRSS
jgi:hypothetical protein